MLRSAMIIVLLAAAAATDTCDVTCDHSSGLIVTTHATTSSAEKHRCWVDKTTVAAGVCTCTCPDIMQTVSFEINVEGMTAAQIQSALATIAQAIADVLGIDVSLVTVEITTTGGRRLVEGNTGVTLRATVVASFDRNVGAGAVLETEITDTDLATGFVAKLNTDLVAKLPTLSALTVDKVVRDNGGVAQPEPHCPASFTLSHATTTITERTSGATASAACAQSASLAFTFNSPTLNLQNVEDTLGGSADDNGARDVADQEYALCGGDDGSSEANQQHLAERFCLYHGYTSASNVQVVTVAPAACAVYHESGTGSRVATLGDKISSITCGNVLGQGVFQNPTMNIDEAETKLGGSGDAADYAVKNQLHRPPDSTIPYPLCAGTNDNGETKWDSGHTNNGHMAQRFCEFEGYTSVADFKIVDQVSGDCAVYHNEGNGRRYDNSHSSMISQIICSDPVRDVEPVLTCQGGDDTPGSGTWVADRSCRCSDTDQIFNDPTVNLFHLEQTLGGSGNPADYDTLKPNHQAPKHNAPYLLCAGTNSDGEHPNLLKKHTNNYHMADRFCKYNGYPGGHESFTTASTPAGGECAVYHDEGTGRRYDDKEITKINQIVCKGQCAI